MRKNVLSCLAAAVAAAGLFSCSPGAALVIRSSSPQLRQELSRLAAEYTRSGGLRVTPSDASSRAGAAVTIGWEFVGSSNDSTPLPLPQEKVQAAGYGTALAFERQARADAGWSSVPILWDAWGIAAARGTTGATVAAGTFAGKGTAHGILLPGGDTGARQALFWFTDAPFPAEGTVDGIVLGGAERSGQVGHAFFKAFAGLGRDPSFLPGSFSLQKPDVENMARNTDVRLLFGSYQWLRGITGATGRDFHPLVYPLPQGSVIPASVLSGAVTGSGAAASRAQEFLLWLLSPENQKALSNATGFMAANFNAANLDPNALDARNAAAGAARVLLIDPEPAKGSAAESWDSLLAGILAKPADWERVLSEREK